MEDIVNGLISEEEEEKVTINDPQAFGTSDYESKKNN